MQRQEQSTWNRYSQHISFTYSWRMARPFLTNSIKKLLLNCTYSTFNSSLLLGVERKEKRRLHQGQARSGALSGWLALLNQCDWVVGAWLPNGSPLLWLLTHKADWAELFLCLHPCHKSSMWLLYEAHRWQSLRGIWAATSMPYTFINKIKVFTN